jgi:hypothetical protein
MAEPVKARTPQQIVKQYRTELTREIRKEANRVLKEVRAAARKGKTGNLRRKIKSRVRWDADGPYARITTSARRVTKSERTRRTTTFRYGLALQQRDHYLQRGLNRTPRR